MTDARAAELLDKICGIIHMTADQREARIGWITNALREAERRVWQEAANHWQRQKTLYQDICGLATTDAEKNMAFAKVNMLTRVVEYCLAQATPTREGKSDE